jgi:hypothetical protein
MSDGFIEDDGGPQIVVRERDGQQALWIRVGPVFDEFGEKEPEPGIWIEYQETHMGSLLQGPVLLTYELWKQINQFVVAEYENTRPKTADELELERLIAEGY